MGLWALPDRAVERLDLGGSRGAWVRPRASALRRRLGDLSELRLRDGEVAEPLEAGETSKLFGARRRIANPERVAEPGDRPGGGGRVESERRRQAERVHRAVGEPVAPAERLRHRVPEREAGSRKRAAGRLGSAEECGAAVQVGAVRENAWKRRRDRGGPAKSPL